MMSEQRVRILFGFYEGMEGVIYDSLPGSAKIQLDGDSAGRWFENNEYEVLAHKEFT